MAFNGNTEDFSPIQILNLIRLTLKTGKLIFTGTYPVEIFISEGQLIYATRHTGERDLLQTVQAAGKLTETQVEKIRQQAAGVNGAWLGSWLLEAGYITKADLAQSIYRQVWHTVYETILQADGQFVFEDGALPALAVPITAIDLRQVIDQGERLLQDWDELNMAVPDLDITLQTTAQLTPTATRKLMSKTEWSVAIACNAQRTIRQIAQVLNLDDFKMRHIVYYLLKIGVVEIVSPPAGDKPDTPSEKSVQPSGFERAFQNIRSSLQQQAAPGW
jgi:hypothetical protein